jgi:hypothetical protein
VRGDSKKEKEIKNGRGGEIRTFLHHRAISQETRDFQLNSGFLQNCQFLLDVKSGI